jgi:hypothetical protein
MKLILSRKGFDSSFGGCASPIFEDHSFISLPIPEPAARISFSDIGGDGRIGKIVEDLTSKCTKPLKAKDHVHLDPDLKSDSLTRKPGWRPLFGQAMAAQEHLALQKVKKGDLFLFFGWFRRVEEHNGKFRFVRGAPDLHMFFGWLEVGETWRLPEDKSKVPAWADEHPHVTAPDSAKTYRSNTIYVAPESGKFGAGTFRSYSDKLVLTQPGKSRSHWQLPKWFDYTDRPPGLTYHSNPKRWVPNESSVYLQTVARGQEFVLDTDHYPEARGWAKALIVDNAA